MDRAKALEIGNRLKGAQVAGWSIERLIDNGKSAAVFKARRENDLAAIKIFDTDLIAKFGGEALLVRNERERSLLNHDCQSLVKMIDAGVDDNSGLHFLAMEYIEGRSLAECLDDIPEDRIADYIQQLALAAQYLEDRGYAHRDIKPANIMVSDDYSKITLLDLGVLKPVGESGLTDHGSELLFIGTNQYASPEFAMRREDDSPDGWRALTFYQIGAVLHDLIMREPIFSAHLGVPARLAHAVQHEVVPIRSATTPPWLVTLCQNCLVKSPETRLRLVRWESFAPKAPKADRALELRDRILQRAAAATTIDDERRKYGNEKEDPDHQVSRNTVALLQEILRTIGRNEPPQLGRRIVYETDQLNAIRCEFEPAARIGLPNGLTLCLGHRVTDPQSNVVRIQGARCDNATSEWNPSAWEEVFEGPWSEEDIRSAVGIFVLASVDSAQSASVKGE